MLKSDVVAKLNEQVGHELYSSIFYLQMSAWCAEKGLDGCAKFLRRHHLEELGHMNRLYDYLVESGEKPVFPKLEAPPNEFENVKHVFDAILEHERFITSKINEMVAVTFEGRDFFTFNFLQWYVAEQHEEEALFKSVLDKLELVGQDDRGLFFFDREMSQMAAAAPDVGGAGGEG